MRALPVTLDLPVALHREIGRVIVGYAMIEHQLSRIIYDILGINPKDGRLAVREPRAIDRLETIFDLVALRGVSVSDDDKKLLRDGITACTSQRDELAHGIWLKDQSTNTLLLRLTKGQWQPVKGQKGKTKRLIKPEGLAYDANDCRELRLLIDEMIHTIEKLHTDLLRAIRASLKKSLPPSPT